MSVSIQSNDGGSLASNAAQTPAAITLQPADEKRLLLRITLRLLPLLFLGYVIAYVDRINVGFAKLHLQQVLGVDQDIFNSIYGLGAGLFFIGYFIFRLIT